jgi:D-glycero-D-manno-heptose 1,7-bisphosphate phosphatase
MIEEVGYLADPGQVRLAAGLIDLLRAARARELAVAVVTNQSGIARGYFGWPEYWSVEAEVERRLAAADARIDGIAACPFHPEHTTDWTGEHARWRKPGPGMIRVLAQDLGIDLTRSWLVGDTASDIAAARAAGLAGAVHILTGHGPKHRDAALALAGDGFPVLTAESLIEVAALLDELGLGIGPD